MIKVSIIVAAYNIENYIGRCIESLIKQTFKDIEIIIVNDGSTDATLKRIKDKANEDSRISVINQENKGLIEARKIGLANAKGKYILFVDGDDWLEVNTIEKLYFNATEINADIVLYNSIWADDDGIVKKQITYSQEESFKDDYIKMFLLGKLSVNIWSKFIKKEFLQGIEFESNISYGEDLITVIKLLINKPKILFADEPTGALNSKATKEVLEILTRLNKENLTIFMVSHDVKDSAHAEKIIYIVYGGIKGELCLGKVTDNSNLKDREEKHKNWLSEMGW